MDESTRSRLSSAAKQYLAVRPWQAVSGDYLFGIDDPATGFMGCVSVLGDAGMEFGLSIQLDVHGFALNQKLIDEELDHSSMLARSDSITFVLSELPEGLDERPLPAFVFERQRVDLDAGLKGFLMAWKIVPGNMPVAPNSEEARFLARCLEAVALVASNGKLKPEAPPRPGEFRFLELSGDADRPPRVTRRWRAIEAPPIVEESITLPQDLRERLLRLPRTEARFLLSLFAPPVNVQGKVVWTALLYDPVEDFVLHGEAAATFHEAALSALRGLAGLAAMQNRPAPVLPAEIWTDSFPAYQALKSAMVELEIRFGSRPEIPELARVKESFSEFVRRAGR